MTAAPLLITPDVVDDLEALRRRAAVAPFDVREVLKATGNPRGERRHRRRMAGLTVRIPGPWTFWVTFSVETGHPAGTCRHLSMSVRRPDRVPHPTAVWLVAAELGFAGGLEACAVYPEDLQDGGIAINVVQPIAVGQERAA